MPTTNAITAIPRAERPFGTKGARPPLSVAKSGLSGLSQERSRRLCRLVSGRYAVRGSACAPVESRQELFDFLTMEANGIVAPNHRKAMPVMLTKSEEADLQSLLCQARGGDAVTG